MTANVFPLQTSGSYTVADFYAGTTAHALEGAASASAAAAGAINAFEINGGGLLPPFVLLGSAVARAEAEATLDVVPTDDFDVAAALAARRHPGWNRRRAQAQLERERAMEATIREALHPTPSPALAVAKPPQRSPAQIAAEMANAQRVQATRQRATEAAIEAQRARIEIQRLQPELAARRRVASFRAVEQLLRQV